MMLSLFCMLLHLPILVAASVWAWTETEFVPFGFFDDAPWIFESEVEINVSVEDCFGIMRDADAWQYWHPEVTNFVEMTPITSNGTGTSEIIFNDPIFNLLLLGPFGARFLYDIYEPDGDDTKRFSIVATEIELPEILGFSALREEFICEMIDDTKSLFTRRVAGRPGLLVKLLKPITFTRFQIIFEKLCPERLVASINAGLLPTSR